MVMVMSVSRVRWGDVDPCVAMLNSVVIYCRCEDWTGWLAATTRLYYDLFFLVTFLISVSFVFLYCRDLLCYHFSFYIGIFVIHLSLRLRCCFVFPASCVVDAVSFKKQYAGRSDYGFHFYMELSQFIYGLLSRSRKSASLPPLNSWEDYMDVAKVADIEKLSCDDFLLNYEFGSVLRGIKGGEAREFRRQCPNLLIGLWILFWHDTLLPRISCDISIVSVPS